VVLNDSLHYSIFFYDPIRLIQDLEKDSVVGEPGMIVISEITQENMLQAVQHISKQGYFEHLRPLA
jgi:hypothetical protein